MVTVVQPIAVSNRSLFVCCVCMCVCVKRPESHVFLHFCWSNLYFMVSFVVVLCCCCCCPLLSGVTLFVVFSCCFLSFVICFVVVVCSPLLSFVAVLWNFSACFVLLFWSNLGMDGIMSCRGVAWTYWPDQNFTSGTWSIVRENISSNGMQRRAGGLLWAHFFCHGSDHSATGLIWPFAQPLQQSFPTLFGKSKRSLSIYIYTSHYIRYIDKERGCTRLTFAAISDYFLRVLSWWHETKIQSAQTRRVY